MVFSNDKRNKIDWWQIYHKPLHWMRVQMIPELMTLIFVLNTQQGRRRMPSEFRKSTEGTMTILIIRKKKVEKNRK